MRTAGTAVIKSSHTSGDVLIGWGQTECVQCYVKLQTARDETVVQRTIAYNQTTLRLKL